jgi:hypothetical protein
VDNMQFSNGVIHWNVSFVRSVQDWEVVWCLNFFLCYIHSDGVNILRIVFGGFLQKGRNLR